MNQKMQWKIELQKSKNHKLSGEKEVAYDARNSKVIRTKVAKQRGKKELTSILKTTISPARIGSLLMCKNNMSPCKSGLRESLADKGKKQYKQEFGNERKT